MSELLSMVQWQTLDTWIVVVGALCGMSCALLGTFLVLRRMSMMGDAISHAVLPGLAIAFLVAGSRGSLVMLVGAGVVGLLTAVFTQWIHRAGRVDEGASMGVVFTVLFAIGLILIVHVAEHGSDELGRAAGVDLDPRCVLQGALEMVHLYPVTLFGVSAPRAFWITAAVFIANVAIVALLYKELKISAFDPALATSLGISADWMHYLLMTLVAITTVVAFESVGSILVIAMLIVPAAAAHLLTDRLGSMLGLAMIIAVIAAVTGHWSAINVPSWVGFDGQSASTAGMIAVVSGLVFSLALLLAPRRGIVSQILNRLALSVRVAREDALGLLLRAEERGGTLTPTELRGAVRATGAGSGAVSWALHQLQRQQLVRHDSGRLQLTVAGKARATELLRSHRLWETYVEEHFHLPTDHVHGPAERLEHVTDPALRERLADTLANPTHDPHGRPIPPNDAT